jgi:hypothetical protein
MLMRSALFWDITQRRVVIVYRRFRTMYQIHLQEEKKASKTLCSFIGEGVGGD